MEKKSFIVSILLTSITILSVIWGTQCASSESSETAPDFSLSAIDGGTLKLSDYKGKVIILDFWATWCPPCRKGIPEFIDLYNNYKDKGLEIIGISLDTDIDKLKRFCKDMGINYPTAIGNPEVTEAYGGIQSIPTTFVIDQEGKIVKKYVGYTESSVFEEQIKALLE